MSQALYVIAEEYRDAAEKLASLDLDEQTIADTLEGLSGELEVKATNVAMFARNLESLANQIKEAEKQMAARRKALEAKSSSIKKYLLDNMTRAGITKIDSEWFSISIKKNPDSVVVDNEAFIPQTYFKQPEMPPPQLDKAAVKKAIKDGMIIEGAHLESTNRIEIK